VLYKSFGLQIAMLSEVKSLVETEEQAALDRIKAAFVFVKSTMRSEVAPAFLQFVSIASPASELTLSIGDVNSVRVSGTPGAIELIAIVGCASGVAFFLDVDGRQVDQFLVDWKFETGRVDASDVQQWLERSLEKLYRAHVSRLWLRAKGSEPSQPATDQQNQISEDTAQ